MGERMSNQNELSSDAWRPRIYNLDIAEDRFLLDELRGQGRLWQIKDTLWAQLADLVTTRLPHLRSRPKDVAAHVLELTDGVSLERYGRWIFYPWSGLLVHLLPPDQFRELRLDRNRHKLTSQDQERLGDVTIGIAGLSTGNSIAVTLALEGIVGHLRLADMDRLELSNMNRLRASIHEIGTEKAVLAARQIAEFDPYLNISLFCEGVTRENISAFFDGEPSVGPKLDCLIEECDSVHMKFLMREYARARGLPVLMQTSDRGMLDVERFDEESTRPLLHGLVDDVSPAEIRCLDLGDGPAREKKVALVARLVNADLLSAGAAASLLEIDSSISTWPQLASDVALAGASVSAAVRRLGLGAPLPSGRRYIDLEQAINEVAEPVFPRRHPTPTRRPVPRPRPRRRTGSIPRVAQYLVSYAIQAPSGGNSQPWHFYWGDNRLWVTHDRRRSASLLDPYHRAAYLALGAAVENIAIAAASSQLDISIKLFPICSNADVIAAISLSTDSDDNSAMCARLKQQLGLVNQRRTRRELIPSAPLRTEERSALVAAAATRETHVDLCLDSGDMKELGLVMGAADRLRFLAPDTHRELVAELRFTANEAEATRDGLGVDTLGLGPTGELAIRLLARADVAAVLRRVGGGARCEQLAQDAVASSSALGLLRATADTPADWVACGRGMQQLWLEAELLGIALHPMTTAIYLFETINNPPRLGFTEDEVATLRALRDRFHTVLPRDARPAALLFRLGRIAEHSGRALRRPAGWVLSAGTPPNPTSCELVSGKECGSYD